MSSVRGGTAAGRGRGTSAPGSTLRGSSNGRGRSSRGRGRGGAASTQRNAEEKSTPSMNKVTQGGFVKPKKSVHWAQEQEIEPDSNEDLADRYARLKRNREKERANAIRSGLLADPEKPRALVDAITPVGTCQDMCAEYERVERAVRNEVWDEEKDLEHSAYARTDAPMDEPRMVKIFKRSAAGDEEQLPSDLRPPRVLLRTCEYLFDELIGNSPSLAKVHNFVWNRTRAVRRDFSIQQLSKPDDLRIAIECYERIARFHILSLHDLAQPVKPYPEYDYKQDREQLDKTLLSLMQYYDDSRGRIELPNEPEFRAYCIVFQLQDFTPDLEDRVQTWPIEVASDSRVQTALEMYAAAGSITELKGPLKTSAIQQFNAQQDWQVFFNVVESTRVSFLMGCVAEIFFNFVRHQTLDCIVRSAPRLRQTGRPNPNHLVEVDVLRNLFAFDEDDETIDFCARYGLTLQESDGDFKIDIGPLAGIPLPQAETPAMPLRTSLISNKRYGRSFPAVISGMNVDESANAGMITLSEEDMDSYDGGQEDEQSLFIPEQMSASDSEMASPTGSSNGFMPKAKPDTSGFGQPSSKSIFAIKSEPAAKSSGESLFKSPFAVNTPAVPVSTAGPSLFAPKAQDTASKPAFNFLTGAPKSNEEKPKLNSLFAPSNEAAASNPPASIFGTASNTPIGTSPFASPFASTKNDSTSAKTEPKPASLFQWGAQAQETKTPEPVGKLEPEPVTKEGTKPPASPFSTSSLFSTPAFLQPTPRSNATPSFLQPTSPPASAASSSTNPFQFPPTSKASAGTNDGLLASTTHTSGGVLSAPSLFPPAVTQPQSANNTNSPPKVDTPGNPSQTAQPTSSSTSHQQTGSAASGSSLAVDEQKLRRSSADTKPRKPSPLSHSFSASDDNPGPKDTTAGALSEKPFPTMNITFGAHNDNLTKAGVPNFKAPTPKPPTINLDTLLSRIAHELTFDPYRGIVKQFVEFHAARIVTEVQQKLYHERIEQEAVDFRRFCLSFRYGRKWRETCRRLRLARQGKERRQRARRRLRESGVHDGSDVGSVSDISFATDQGSTRNLGRARQQPTNKQATVDALFQSTNGGSRYSAERLGQKRPAGTNPQHDNDTSGESRHKRAKSDERTPAADRRSTLSAIDDPRAELKRRSAFLGFVLPHDAPEKGTTTQTTYFKLVAMGIDPNDDYGVPSRGTKRQRAESVNHQSSITSNQLRLPPAAAHLEQVRTPTEAYKMLPPPPKGPRVTNDADEALFARLRAARDGLKDDTAFMRSSTSQAPEPEKALSARSSGASPSLVLARAEARLRASRGLSYGSPPSNSKDRSVPAYRLRESRFVPREQYSRAIERANEIRSNRSRESSRPGSRAGFSFTGSPVTPQLDFSAYQGRIIGDDQAVSTSDKADSARVNEESGLPHVNVQNEATVYDAESQNLDTKITDHSKLVEDHTMTADPPHESSEKAYPSAHIPSPNLNADMSFSAFNTQQQPMWSFSTTEQATSQNPSPQHHRDSIPEAVQGMPDQEVVQILDFTTGGIPHFEPPAPLVNHIQSELLLDQSLDHTIHIEDIPNALSASFGPAETVRHDVEAATVDPLTADSYLEADQDVVDVTHVPFVPPGSEDAAQVLEPNGDIAPNDAMLTEPASPSSVSRKWLASGTNAFGGVDQAELARGNIVKPLREESSPRRARPPREQPVTHDHDIVDEGKDEQSEEDGSEVEDDEHIDGEETSETEEPGHHSHVLLHDQAQSEDDNVPETDSQDEDASAEDDTPGRNLSQAAVPLGGQRREPLEDSNEEVSDAEGEGFDEEDTSDLGRARKHFAGGADVEEEYSDEEEGSFDEEEQDGDDEEDLEGEDDEDEDGEDYSSGYDEDEDDGAAPQHHQNRHGAYPLPAPNPALLVVGGTQEEAIELSD